MRTTVVLNNQLVVLAKKMAAEKNTSLSAIINDALRERLSEMKSSERIVRFQMPVYRGDGPMTDTEPAVFTEWIQGDDLSEFE